MYITFNLNQLTMKQLKFTLIALFALVSISSLNAQEGSEKNESWTIGFGFNAIDFNSGDSAFEDYFGNSDWNISNNVSRITAGRYLNDAFYVEAAASINKIHTLSFENDVDWLYYSFDVNVGYDLNELFGDTDLFDPFVSAGFGFAKIQGDTQVSSTTFNFGVGFNLWIVDNVALNFRTNIKTALGDDIENHLQNSVGLLFNLGSSDE